MAKLIPSLILAAGLWPGLAMAEVRALLVGVSDYLILDADLKGPAQDVSLMAEVLAARGVKDMSILTDQAVPTKAAITTAMADLAGRAQPGDTVVFYFSGHGAQAPDLSGDEGGGYDEILLPADAAGWKGAIGAVENALSDDELMLWAQGLLGQGVKLVGILDACHSDTGFRGLPVGGSLAGVARGLSLQDLGVPGDVASVIGPSQDGPSRVGPSRVGPLRVGPLRVGPLRVGLSGEFVFLYSSQSDQRSFEYPVGDTGLWQGAFTKALAAAIHSADGASWSQVLAVASDAMVQGPVRQDPSGEGPLLASGLFGTVAGPVRLAVLNGTVQGGALQGLEAGAVLAFYASASGGTPLGQTPIRKVEARRAIVDGIPAGAAWAEVILPAPLPPLRLGSPIVTDDAHYDAWLTALKVVDAAAPPDLIPVLTGGELALTQPDGLLDPAGPGSSPRVTPEGDEGEGDALARVLEQAAHALRLRKLLASLSGRSLTGQRVDVTTTARQGQVAGEGCGAVVGEKDIAKGVVPCDQIWLHIANSAGRDMDVSVLYFAADFTVAPVWPQSGLSNRLAPGEKVRVGLQITPGSAPGFEEIMVLAVPAEPGGMVDLTRLASPAMTRAFAGASDAVTMWIEDRMSPQDETARGFAIKPAALNMTRQMVRIVGQGAHANATPFFAGEKE